MSWMSQLYKTYEKQFDIRHLDENSIAPVGHMFATAQIEVTLTAEGDFSAARRLEKEEGRTLIPVTEESAGRSSGIAPHSLCDVLAYVAGDFGLHCSAEKDRMKSEEKFSAYMENLEAWVKSDSFHPKVEAIFTYLQKEVLISDLVRSGIVTLGQDGSFDRQKISGQPYEKAMVRFRVMGTGSSRCDGTWEDDSLIASYLSYYLSDQARRTDICYLTGQEKMVSDNHPKGIVAADYGAKLVSANDTQGYTYRGRFQDAGQACALSYDVSQKIHNALTWLVKQQGVVIGSQEKRTFVCWNPEGHSTLDICNPFGVGDDDTEEDDAPRYYREKLQKMFRGYRTQFAPGDQVIVMSLDAATTGRLSITYYNEFDAQELLNRMEEWGLSCRWYFQKWTPEKKPYFAEETPTFRRIAECAFGRQRGAFLDLDDKVLKEQTQRLIKCMLERQPFPQDIEQALVERASTPMAYSRGNWENVLSTACAVITKRYVEHGVWKSGEEEQMRLDVNNGDRSYLFGRLLAVLEKVERSTYERGESREPNAMRLQSAFVNHPMQTWMVLDEAVRPYFQRLGPGSREYYKGMISEIMSKLHERDEDSLNKKLEPSYLLGYYLQRMELNQKKGGEKDEQLAEQD